MFWAPGNDFWAIDASGNTAIANCSLTRNASDFYERQSITMEEVMINDGRIPYPFTPTDELFRAPVGPFGSIDTTWIMYPKALYDLVGSVTQVVNSISMVKAELRNEFHDIGRNNRLYFLPHRWANDSLRFVGGSPLCSMPYSVTYPIEPFSFNDICSTPTMEALDVDAFTFVFVALTSGLNLSSNVGDLCQDVTSDNTFCASGLEQAQAFIESHISTLDGQRLAQQAEQAWRKST